MQDGKVWEPLEASGVVEVRMPWRSEATQGFEGVRGVYSVWKETL